MIDALGQPQSVLVLGGTSEIAQAIVRALPPGRLRRVVLAGRPSATLDTAAGDLEAHLSATRPPHAAICSVRPVGFDAEETAAHGSLVDSVFDAGDVDVVVLAFGLLGDQASAEAEPAQAVRVAQVNYVGAVSVGLHVARRLARQGSGELVVLSSVAGLRARRSNFVYGSSKAGLDAFAQGLADALHGSGAHVLVVRPGFVRTRMTAGLPAAPLAADPDQVGAAVVAALRAGHGTVYVPGALRLLMAGLRAVPRPLFRRLPL
ncbi:MAG: decaprenylphospho-beta-D-erythro-pentofuranosid-2-ulose 2-reductase [Actinomycetes bacterium]